MQMVAHLGEGSFFFSSKPETAGELRLLTQIPPFPLQHTPLKIFRWDILNEKKIYFQ